VGREALLYSLADLACVYGIGGNAFFFDESLYLVDVSVTASCMISGKESTHDVQGLLRPVTNEWPCNDGYPLTRRNVAVVAVVEKLVRYRHDASIVYIE
jgi:hypothetical protein